MYYNTTHEVSDKLKEYQEKADSQEHIIYNFLFENPNVQFTADEILVWRFSDTGTPITSIRRALTNLYKEGKIVKSSDKKEGAYGRSTYCWYVPSSTNQIKMFI